jgi:methyl-accepting chemotaxis protein
MDTDNCDIEEKTLNTLKESLDDTFEGIKQTVSNDVRHELSELFGKVHEIIETLGEKVTTDTTDILTKFNQNILKQSRQTEQNIDDMTKKLITISDTFKTLNGNVKVLANHISSINRDLYSIKTNIDYIKANKQKLSL